MLSSIISGVKLLRGLRGFLYVSDSRFDIDWVLPNNTCKDKSEILPSNSSAETQYLRISTLLRRLILTSNASSLESPQITHFCYRKIPKISPGAYIFKRRFLRASFWRGLYSEGLIYGAKFAFQNRFG